MMDIYNQIELHEKLSELFKNKVMTTVSFVFLGASLFFIQLHPASVWYYFAAGFFASRMLQLIWKKSSLKIAIDTLSEKIKKLGSL